jgi:hypothetical protein
MWAFVGLAVGALLLATVVGVGGGYWHYTRTPTYSLEQIRKAVAAHDRQLFEQYVDVDSVCGAAVDKVVAAAHAGKEAPKNQWDPAGQNMGNSMTLERPALVSILKQQLASAVEKGMGDFINPGNARLEGPVTLDGKTAKVGFALGPPPGGLHMTVRLRDRGSTWQVVEVDGLQELLQAVPVRQ